MKQHIIILFFFCFILSTNSVFSQPPNTVWAKCYGGSSDDEAKCIRQTSDGGYIIAGETSSAGGNVSGFHGGNESDIWITKLDSTGNLQWQKCYGGSNYDKAYSIQQTTEGGYIIAGVTRSVDGDVRGWHAGTDRGGSPSFDFWVFKITNSGQLQWQQCLGGSKSEVARAIVQTADGGYIVAGEAASSDGVNGYHPYSPDPYTTDCWIVKLNSTGGMVWNKAYGSTGNESAWSVLQARDGGYLISGQTGAPPPGDGDVLGIHGYEYDAWIVKTDSIGNLEWQKCLGGSNYEVAYNAVQTATGEYIVTAVAGSVDGDVQNHIGSEDIWVLSLSSTGVIQWQQCYGGSFNDRPHSIRQTADGGYIIASETQSTNNQVTGNHGSFDYWLVKISSTGTMEWQKTLGGADADQAFSAQETNDGGYIIAGNSLSTTGEVTGNHGDNDFWVVKLGPPPCTVVIRIATPFLSICPSTPVTFTATVINGGMAPVYQWKVNGANVGSNTSSFITNSLSNYDVISCILIPNNGCTTTPVFSSNSVSVTVRQPVPANIGSDKIICEGTTTALATTTSYRSYRWQDGSQQPRFIAIKAGMYYVQTEDSCGILSSDTAIVSLYPQTTSFLPADTAICNFETFVVKASQAFRNYLWNTNSIAPVLVTNSPGQYWLRIRDSNGCIGTDTITLKTRNCGNGLYIPSAFTPNSDSYNDVFRPRTSGRLLRYQLTVFDRWGRKVFTTNNIDKGWDGRSSNGLAESAVFIWVCNYQLDGEPVQVKRGTVTLIR